MSDEIHKMYIYLQPPVIYQYGWLDQRMSLKLYRISCVNTIQLCLKSQIWVSYVESNLVSK